MFGKRKSVRWLFSARPMVFENGPNVMGTTSYSYLGIVVHGCDCTAFTQLLF